MAPIEVLKGHLPSELTRDIYSGLDIPQPTKSAFEIVKDVWERRNVANLEKTQPSSEPNDSLTGKRLEWSVGINNKKYFGSCLKSLSTAVQIKLDSGRTVWVPRTAVRSVITPNFST